MCNNETPLHLGGWDFALERGLLRAPIVIPPSPSAMEHCCVMEMKLRAVLTAELVGGTCGYQAGGLDTQRDAGSSPSQKQLFRHYLSKTAPHVCRNPRSQPPWCNFSPCYPQWSELVVIALARNCKYKCSWRLYAALGSGSQRGHPPPPSGAGWSPAGVSPIQLRRLMAFQLRSKYVCTMNHVPSSVTSRTTDRITPARDGRGAR